MFNELNFVTDDVVSLK